MRRKKTLVEKYAVKLADATGFLLHPVHCRRYTCIRVLRGVLCGVDIELLPEMLYEAKRLKPRPNRKAEAKARRLRPRLNTLGQTELYYMPFFFGRWIGNIP